MSGGLPSARPAGEPTVGIVGLGLIGGSIAKRLAQPDSGYGVLGFAPSARTVAAAQAFGLPLAGSVAQLAGASDLVVVAGPPNVTVRLVAELLTSDPQVLVTDVASVKRSIVDGLAALAAAPEHPLTAGDLTRYLPAHPLAGSEAAGFDAATPELLDRAIWAICPPVAGAPLTLLTSWTALLDVFEARVIVCDPREHDAAVARTSHAPHLAAAAIASTLMDAPAALSAALSGGGFRDTTRIAGSELELWRQIIELNRDEVGAVLDQWIAQLGDLRRAVTDPGAPPADHASGTTPDGNASDNTSGTTPDGALAEIWERGRAGVALAREIRWAEPVWAPAQQLAWPAWDALLDLGRAGRAVRALRADAAGIVLDVAQPPALTTTP